MDESREADVDETSIAEVVVGKENFEELGSVIDDGNVGPRAEKSGEGSSDD